MKNHLLLKRLRGASAQLALLTLGTLSWGWALGQSNYIVGPEIPEYFSNYFIGLSPADTELSTMKGIENLHGVTYDPDAFVNAAQNGSVMLPMPVGSSSNVQWRNFTTTDSYTGTIWDDVLQIWRPFTAFTFVESDMDLGAAVVFDDGDLAIVQFHEYRSTNSARTSEREAILIYTDNTEEPNRAFIGRSRKLDLATALGTAGTSGMPVGAAPGNCEVIESPAGGGAPTTAATPATTAFEINGVRALNIGLSYTAGVRGLLPSFLPISTHAVLYSSLANGVLRPELGLVLRAHFTHFVTEDLVADVDSDTGNDDKRATIAQNMHAFESSLSGLPTMHSGQILMYGGGGVASGSSVCLPSSLKYFGSSRLDEPFDLERLKTYVHELGHQLGSGHTFNANNVQRATSFAYEAGSGYSIMGYAHECPEEIAVPGGGSATVNHKVMGLTKDRIRATPEWEDYYANVRLKYHTFSVEKMNEHLNNNCPSLNVVPAVGPNVVLDLAHGTSEFSEAGSEIVPLGKPVLLAVTPEANTTYRWHQMDLGPADANPDLRATANDGVGPKVAINGPTRDGMTFIPARDYLLGTATPDHHFSTLCDNHLTSYNFRVQGNRFIPQGAPGAGSQGQIAISASGLVNVDCEFEGVDFDFWSGPWDAPAGTLFATTELGSGSNEALLETQLTWNVGGTDEPPFSSNTVDIYRITGTDASTLEMIAEGIPNEGSIVLELPPSPIGEDGNPEDIRLLIKLPDAIWFELSAPFQILYAGCTDPNFDTYDPQANLHDPSACLWDNPVPPGFGSAACMDLNACNYNPGAQIHVPNSCTYAACNDPDALNASFAVIAGVNAPANCTGGDCVYDEHACLDGAWLAPGEADLGWAFHGPYAAEAWSLDNWGVEAYSQFVSDYPNKLVFTDQSSRMHLIGGRTSSADGAQVMEASIVAAQTGLVTFDWQVVESSATNQSDLVFRRNGEVLDLPLNANWSNSWRVDEIAPLTGSFSVELYTGDVFDVVVITTADVETPVGVIVSDFRYETNAVAGCMDPEAVNFNPLASCGDSESCNYLENLQGSACYDPGACNFEGILPGVFHNPAACTYPGCTDDHATNYDPMAGCDSPCCYTGDCDFASGGNLWGKYNETWEEYDPIPGFDDVMYLAGGMVLTSPQTTTPMAQSVSYTFNGSEAEKVSFMFAWVPGLMQLPADMLSPARFQVWEGSVLVQEYVLDENTGVPLSATAMDFPSQAFALPLSAWPGDPFEMDPTLESGALLHTYEELPTFEATFRGLEIDVLPGQEVRMVMYADSQDMVYDETPCRLYITGAKMPQQCGVANMDEFLGCMDPTACNYDPAANLDDGSCEAAGCMDPAALNYNENATCQTACFYPSDCGNWLTADTDYAYGFNGAFAPGLAAENTIPSDLLITENNLMTIVGPDYEFGGTSGVAAVHEISWVAQVDMEVQFAYAAASYDSGYDFDRAFYRKNDAEVVLDANAGELMVNGTWLVTSEDWNPGPDYVLPTLADVPYEGFEDQIHVDLHLLKTPIPMLAGDTLTLGVKSDDNVFGPVVLAVMGMVWTDHCVAGPEGVEIVGCTDPSACTYSPEANVHDDELCLFPGSPCNDGDACTFDDTMSDACSCKGDFQDADGDDVCDLDDVCPNNPDFTTEEGPCGCESIVDGNGNGIADCLESCDSDLDGDGVCDAEDGCPENPDLTEEGICGCFTPSDSDDDGICDEFEVPGCTDPLACNFNADATDDDGTCAFDGPACACSLGLTFATGELAGGETATATATTLGGFSDGAQYAEIILEFSSTYNYASELRFGICAPNGNCAAFGGYAWGLDYFDLGGLPDNWSSLANGTYTATIDLEAAGLNGEGVWTFEFLNSWSSSINSLGSWSGTIELFGNCGNDEIEVAGCTDPTACNFEPYADVDDGSCAFPGDVCDDGDACTFNDQWSAGCECLGTIVDTDGDGICDLDEIPGCTDDSACNFDPLASDDDGSCAFSGPDCACAFQVEFDTDSLSSGESITLTVSESMIGGLDSIYVYVDFSQIAYNFADHVLFGICAPNGNCVEFGGYDLLLGYPSAGGFDNTGWTGGSMIYLFKVNLEAFDLAGYGVWTIQIMNGFSEPLAEGQWEGYLTFFGFCADHISGCMDEEADNYDPDATEPGTCYYEGCKESLACNYDPQANVDDGSCIYPGDLCLMPGPCNSEGYMDENCNCQFEGPGDSNGNGICDDEDLSGCTDELACNFNPEATLDDGSCNAGVWMIPLELGGALSPAILTCDSDLPDGYVIGDFDCVQYVVDNDAYCLNTSWDSVCQSAYESCLDTCDDTDGDGVCDADEVPGCMDQGADNYNQLATDDDGSCEYGPPGIEGCTDSSAFNFDPSATLDDGSCVYGNDDYYGCTDPFACNYNDMSVVDDGSCEYTSCGNECISDVDGDGICDDEEVNGCTDSGATNYDPLATDDDGSCDYSAIEVGCTYESACNYDPAANSDDGTCFWPASGEDCSGNCLLDANGDGLCDNVCDGPIISGCTDDQAWNYHPYATDDDGSCSYAPVYGCTDLTACNYDASAESDDGSCAYPAAIYLDCEGECISDTDGDGVCDGLEIFGCTDSQAWNYQPYATDDDGSCSYAPVYGCTDLTACNYNASAESDDGSCTYPPEIHLNCEGECISDTDGDGVCDGLEIFGCTDPQAWNYQPYATDDDGGCSYAPIYGCTDLTACNYNASAESDDGSCAYPPAIHLNCEGECISDTDGDGVCDGLEIFGCTDPQAWNYHPYATDDDGSCSYAPVYGCNDPEACNYDASAESNDGSCTYPPAIHLNCEGACISDGDGDGICDEFEIVGCLDPEASNYFNEATDPGVCFYAEEAGCTYAGASNYSESALWDDGTCLFDGGANSCPSDLNDDGLVSISDLLLLLSAYGEDCE